MDVYPYIRRLIKNEKYDESSERINISAATHGSNL